MKNLTEQFLTFVESKPKDEEYDYCSSSTCAFAQFARAYKIPNPDRFSYEIPEPIKSLIGSRPWTFGALADRLRALS